MASGLSSLYKGSDELTLDCDVCKYQGLTSQAISYCEVCTEALCQVCDKVHRASKQTRDHKLLTGNQIPCGSQRVPAVMMCDTHQLPIEYFCNKDKEVLCSTCKVTAHRSCDTAKIAKKVAKTNPGHLLGKLKQQLQNLEKEYEGFEKKRINDKGVLKTDIQACFDELTRIRHDINDILDEMERKLKAEISAAQDKVTKEIGDHLVIADDMLRQIRESIKLLNESEKSQQDDVMFVATKKTENILPKYEKITGDLESEWQDTSISISLEPSGRVKERLERVQPFGELVHQTSFLNMSVGKGTHHDINCAMCQSIIFLPEDRIVLACFEDGLKLLDKHFQIKSELSIRAITACMVSDSEILVACGNQAKIESVDVSSTLVPQKTINTGRHCTGVDFNSNEIYVTCHDNPGNGEVRVLDRNGQLQRRLGFDGKHYMFEAPCGVKVTKTGDKVIVTDEDTNIITCLDQQGQVVYRYTNTDLKKPFGILLDPFENLLACGTGYDGIHIISKDGLKRKIMLSKQNGIRVPACISYRPRDGCLAVGMGRSSKTKLCTFDTKA